MFQIGDKVAHPMHGAGIISDIVEENISERGCQNYYVFEMLTGGLVLKIPVNTSQMIGLRGVVDPEEADGLIASLSSMKVEMNGNWNLRYRENMQRLKSGDLYEVAKVIKGLAAREHQRGLSNGERKMLHTAKQILISEFALVLNQDYHSIENKINMAMAGEMVG